MQPFSKSTFTISAKFEALRSVHSKPDDVVFAVMG
jgi:hypothetical protein